MLKTQKIEAENKILINKYKYKYKYKIIQNNHEKFHIFTCIFIAKKLYKQEI